jgi:hypothetical protein
MLINAANHTITLHEDFAVIVPNAGAELTAKGIPEIHRYIKMSQEKNTQ